MDLPSFVKALKAFFDNSPPGRKLDITEIKALSTQDKHDLSAMLMPVIPHVPYSPAK